MTPEGTTMPDTPQILPPYTGDAACCAKCGQTGAEHPGIGTGFGQIPDTEKRQQPNLIAVFAGQEDLPERKLPSFMRGYPVGQEFLARQCQRCSYIWLEACLDDPNLAFGAGS